MAARNTFPLSRPPPAAWPPGNASGGPAAAHTPVAGSQQAVPGAAAIGSMAALARRGLATRSTLPSSRYEAGASSIPLVRRGEAQPPFVQQPRQSHQMQTSVTRSTSIVGPSTAAKSLSASLRRPASAVVQPAVQPPRARSPALGKSDTQPFQLGVSSPRNPLGLSTTPRAQLGVSSPRAAASTPVLMSPRKSVGSESGPLSFTARTMTPPYASASVKGTVLPMQRLQQQVQRTTPQVRKQLTSVGTRSQSVEVPARSPEPASSSTSPVSPDNLGLKAPSPERGQRVADAPVRSREDTTPHQNQPTPGPAHFKIHGQSPSDMASSSSRAMSSSGESDAIGISAVGPFAEMDPRLLHFFIIHSKQRIAEKGDVFFAEGECDDRMYIVVQGEVEVMHAVLPGHKPFTRILRAPAYFGESCALRLRQQRSATVRAQTVCEVRVLSGETVRNLLSQFPREEKAILEESKMRLAGLAIWEGVSRKRSEELLHGRLPVSGSTTSWSQESSVPVSRRGSLSDRSCLQKTSSLNSQASSGPTSRKESKSPVLDAQDVNGKQSSSDSNGKQTSSSSTGHSTDPRSFESGCSPRNDTKDAVGTDGVQNASSSQAGLNRFAHNADTNNTADRLAPTSNEHGISQTLKPWMVALAESTSSRDSSGSGPIASEIPCEFAWNDPYAHHVAPLEFVQHRPPPPPSAARDLPGISREDCNSVSSQSSPRASKLAPASSMTMIPGTSSLRILPTLGSLGKPCLDSPLEDDQFDVDCGPKHSSNEASPPLTSSKSSPQALSPANGQGSRKQWLQRASRRHRRHQPPKPREGWQRSLCEQVVINYPSALPSKDTFVKRKVPRPVSREASCGSSSSALMPDTRVVVAEENTVLPAGLPVPEDLQTAAQRLRESSPELVD